MDRRTFFGTLAGGLLASPLAAKAQQTGRVWRIGCLWAPASVTVDMDAFRRGLRELGYVEGRDLLIESRFAEGRDDRLQDFAAELVRLKPDVIVTVGTSAALVAKKMTAAIPIIFTVVSDPVAFGLVRTLARPGENVTGLATIQIEITGKRLSLLKEAVPSLRSIALLANPEGPRSAQSVQESRIAARRLGLEVRVVEARDPDELKSALTALPRGRAEALVLVPDPFLYTYRTQIVELAAKGRRPVVGWQSHLAESGALLSYGANTADVLRRAAVYVDKILKGAKPADLPVEQPTKFELVINLKTAKALGLTIPQSVLGRADEVIHP